MLPATTRLLPCLLLAGAAAAADDLPNPVAGVRPPTAEEQAAFEREAIVLDAVVPNRTAFARVNDERAARGLPPLAETTVILAADDQDLQGATRSKSRTVQAKVGTAQAPAAEALAVEASALLPTAVDNSTQPWFPPIRSQGSLGSCASFSSTYYLATYMRARARGLDVRSTANTDKLSPRFIYNLVNGGQDGGSSIFAPLICLKDHGAPLWVDWPYNGDYRSWPTTAPIWRKAIDNRMGNFGQVAKLDTAAGRQTAKQLLANGWVLLISTTIRGHKTTTLKNDPATPDDDAIVGKKVVRWSAADSYGHAMTIVGYDDAAWTDIDNDNVVDPAEKGAFKIANQWGASYGNAGFIYMAYDAIGSASELPGVSQPNRVAGITNMLAYWLAPRPAGYAPTLLAEATVTTAYRGNLDLRFGHGDGSSTVPSTVVAPKGFANGGFGIAMGFTGTSDASTATLVADLSDLVPSGQTRRWFILDRTYYTGEPNTLSGFRLVDGVGNPVATTLETSPAGGLPLTSNQSTVSAWTTWTAPIDTIPPATVTDLRVVSGGSPTRLTVEFTAPGDDGMHGIATAYDLRRSTAPITAANFGAATPVTGLPRPATGGSFDTLDAAGLAGGSTWYFALRAQDDAGNWSAVSNSVSGTTPAVLAITTPSPLPSATVGAPYTCTLAASGGAPPVSWSLPTRYFEDSTGTAALGTGGTALGVGAATSGAVLYTFPSAFRFPINAIRTSQVRVYRDGRLDFEQVTPTPASLYVYATSLAMTAPGEDVFVRTAPGQVSFRWRAHLASSASGVGAVEVEAILHSDGNIRLIFGSTASGVSPSIRYYYPPVWATSSFSGSGSISANSTTLFYRHLLPPGLALDGATGVIAGTPTTAGSWAFTLNAIDQGQSAAMPTSLTVVAPSSTPAILASDTTVDVTEGGSAGVDIRLSSAPAGTVTVAVARSAGDASLTATPSSLTFTPTTWNTTQRLTLAAAADADAVNGTATFRCTATNAVAAEITAREIDDDVLAIRSSAGTVNVPEGGSATVQITLGAQPTANVTVAAARLTGGDADLGASPASLTFTPANWSTAQTLTLAAAQDADAVNGTATIRLSATGLAAVDLTVREQDDDVLAIRSSAGTVNVPEGGSATVQIALGAQPTANVTVAAARLTGGDADLSASPTSLTFTPANWNTAQTLTLAAAQDADAANGTATIRLSATGLTAVDLTVREQDDDALAIRSSAGTVNVPEGGSATVQITLGAQPTANVTVAAARLTGGDADLGVSPSSLTFTPANWNTAQTLTLAAAQDADAANGTATIRLSATGLTAVDLTVREQDDDALAIRSSAGTVNVPEGGSATVQITLGAQPTANVTVAAARLTGGDADLGVSPSSLTFTPANWSTAQPLTISAAQDADAINGTATIRLSAGGLAAVDIAATELDDEVRAILATPASISVNEGGSATIAVRLSTPPAASTVITVARGGGGDPDLTITPSSLTFTPTNWDQPQAVNCRAAQDSDIVSSSANILLSATGWRGATVVATEVDDDIGIITSPAGITMAEGGVATLNARLSTRPAATVEVAVGISSTAATLTRSPEKLVFTTENWSTFQPITLQSAHDADRNNNASVLDLTMPGAEAHLSVIEMDDDRIAIVCDAASLVVPEGGSGEVRVTLASAPAADVAVSVVRQSGDADLTVTPASLLFTPSDWNKARVVRISAAVDADATVGRATIRLSGSGLIPNEIAATEGESTGSAANLSEEVSTSAGSGGGCGFGSGLAGVALLMLLMMRLRSGYQRA